MWHPVFQIEIALLPGQGGTPADGEAIRSKGNSWNIQEAAAQSGFILYWYVRVVSVTVLVLLELSFPNE